MDQQCISNQLILKTVLRTNIFLNKAFFFFLSETNIFIHQTIDKYKKHEQSFKDEQQMVECNQEIEPQKLVPPHKNLHINRSKKIGHSNGKEISNKGGRMLYSLLGKLIFDSVC